MKIVLEVDGDIDGIVTEEDKEAIVQVLMDRLGGLVLSEDIDGTDRFAFMMIVTGSLGEDVCLQDRRP